MRLGLALLGALLLVQLAAWAGGADPLRVDMTAMFQSPNTTHWLGADDLGRDELARLAAGMRTSLWVGAVVLAITSALGITLGLLAGWFGGIVDVLTGKLAEVVLSFPGLLLALALAALVGQGAGIVVVALGVLGWVGFFRLTRVEVQKLKGLPYVQAAKLAGVTTGKLWVRHVLPNAAGPLLVEALLVLAGTMVAEAGLSFLGLGIPAPQPSLGGMVQAGMRGVLVAPMLVVWPSVVLISLSVCANVLARGLRVRWLDGRNANHD